MKSKILLFVIVLSVLSCTKEKLTVEQQAVIRLTEAANNVFEEQSYESFFDQEFYELVSEGIENGIPIDELYSVEEVRVQGENALNLMLESSEEFAAAYFDPLIESMSPEELLRTFYDITRTSSPVMGPIPIPYPNLCSGCDPGACMFAKINFVYAGDDLKRYYVIGVLVFCDYTDIATIVN